MVSKFSCCEVSGILAVSKFDLRLVAAVASFVSPETDCTDSACNIKNVTLCDVGRCQ